LYHRLRTGGPAFRLLALVSVPRTNTTPVSPLRVKILNLGCPVLGGFPRAGLLVGLPMPKGLRRRYGLRHLHFITCSCYRRLPLFASARAKNHFVKILGEVRDRYGFALVGYVVMPNHIHLLIGEPVQVTPSTVMQVLKQRVSRRLGRKPRSKVPSLQLRLPFRHARDFLPQFWRPRFYDLRVRALLGARPKVCLESDEVRREAPLYPDESANKEIGGASTGLALGQFFVLREEGVRASSHRLCALSLGTQARSKAPPFKNRRAGHPRFNYKGRALMPAEGAVDDLLRPPANLAACDSSLISNILPQTVCDRNHGRVTLRAV
jgi:REP element-mobilizing transposase RayT